MDDLNKKMAKGAAWMMLFTFTQRSLGIISTVILARLLIPEDFGLVAIAMSIFAALEIMGAFSFDLALIQNQKASRQHYDTAWSFNVLYGIFAAIALVLLAEPTAIFFEEPNLDGIMYFLSLATLIQGFENIGIIAFRKELNFRKEFNFLITKKIISFLVTVSLAFTFKNYWALVAGIITSKFAGVLISYMMHSYRPRFSLAKSAELFHFSKWVLINNVLIFLNIRGIDLLIGKTAGAQSLGLYSISYEISNLPTTELVFPITRAVFPGYAKMSGNLATLRKGFLDVFSLITLFAIPVGSGIAIMADPIVQFFLGEKWLDSIPLIQALAVVGIFRALQANTGAIYLALGVPKIITYLSIFNIILIYPTIAWALTTSGVLMAAWAIAAVALVSMPINFIVLARNLQLNLMQLINRLWRPVASSLFMTAIVLYTSTLWGETSSTLVLLTQLILLSAVGATAYSASLFLLLRTCTKNPEASMEVKLAGIVKEKLKSRIKRPKQPSD
ncbi:MAG: lipopolysaccharide biosynthesis protein [Gammaproteobacteria bacterium]|nr:lipopolysaccharide biosynthesis protein [Gammaproteobacteria bacterium]